MILINHSMVIFTLEQMIILTVIINSLLMPTVVKLLHLDGKLRLTHLLLIVLVLLYTLH